MKKLSIGLLFLIISVSVSSVAEAKTAYYKSAKSGQFVSKKKYNSSPSTTYRSYRK